MASTDGLAIEVEGLRELRAALKSLDAKLPREVGQAGKKAADVLAPYIRAKVPVRSGRARGSVRAVVSQGGGGVKFGGAKTSYAPWLEFGGRVGKADSVVRKFVPSGRYMYPTLAARRDEVLEEYLRAVRQLIKDVGLDD